MTKLKFKFQDEKNNIQFQITESRQTLRNATKEFFKAKKLFNEVSGKQKKKIQLLTWKLIQLRKLEKEGNFIE